VSAELEWERVGRHLEAILLLAHQAGKLLSVDTRHENTAIRALEYGVDWVNFVSGNPSDTLIRPLAAANARIVIMHNLGIPSDKKHVLPDCADPLETILEWGEQQVQRLEAGGVRRQQIILDPGIGFGKTGDQSWQIVRNPGRLKSVGVDLLYGHSRKSFLAACGRNLAAERDPETHLVSLHLALSGVQYLRVHDVAGCRQALSVAAQLVGDNQGMLVGS
jgi:dihydropteroate synthase